MQPPRMARFFAPWQKKIGEEGSIFHVLLCKPQEALSSMLAQRGLMRLEVLFLCANMTKPEELSPRPLLGTTCNDRSGCKTWWIPGPPLPGTTFLMDMPDCWLREPTEQWQGSIKSLAQPSQMRQNMLSIIGPNDLALGLLCTMWMLSCLQRLTCNAQNVDCRRHQRQIAQCWIHLT